MFMVLSSWHSQCESSPGSFDECRLSAGWPPTLRLNQPIWAVSPPIGCYHPQTPSPFYYYSARKLNQPIESRPNFKTCNSSLAHITCTTNDQHISSSCKGTSGLLHIHGVKHSDFCCFKGMTCMSPLHCVINWEVFTLIFDVFLSLMT